MNYKTVFVLTPHPDDLEFGCGGTVARLIENGSRVVPIVFTRTHTLDWEMGQSFIKVFGMDEYISMNLPLRDLPSHRQTILEELIRLKNKHNPDLVLQPTLLDMHQDHHTVAMEGLRAFKKTNLFGYENPWNHTKRNVQLYVSLEPRHLDKKIKAIACYKSQTHRPYADEEYTRGLAKVCGVQVDIPYAEAFTVIRQVM